MSKKQSLQKMVEKQISAVYDDAHAKIKKILKDNDAIMMINCWNKPDGYSFLEYHNDVNKYLRSYTNSGEPVIGSTCFVTHADLEKFKTETWPKLFAKWKRTYAEPDKKRLREQIKELEDKLAKLDELN